MTIPKIEASRSWNITGLEKLINSKKFYVDAPEKREQMMDFVKSSTPTYENIYRVATDIKWNSKKNITINEIMALIEKNAVDIEFSIVDDFNPFDFD